MTDDEKLKHNFGELIAQLNRPYRLTNAMFAKTDDDGWELSHQGLVARGETPSMAADNFDHIWQFGK